MQRILLFLCVLCCACQSGRKISQLSIHTNFAPFFLTLNGTKMNQEPVSDIRVTNLPPKQICKVQLTFLNSQKKTYKTLRMRPKKDLSCSLRKNIWGGYKVKLSRYTSLKKATQNAYYTGFLYDMDNPPTQTVAKKEEQPVIVSTPSCIEAMRTSDFEEATNLINTKEDDEIKLTIAKQMVKQNCLSTQQVKTVGELLKTEDARLEFVMFAHYHTIDTNNYYLLNSLFESNTSIKKFNYFLSKVEKKN